MVNVGDCDCDCLVAVGLNVADDEDESVLERPICDCDRDTVIVDENIADGELRESVWLVLMDIVSVDVSLIKCVGVDNRVMVTDWEKVSVAEPPPRRRWIVSVRE